MAVGPHTGRRLILRDSVDNAGIRAFAGAEGWTYRGDIERDPANHAFYEAKWSLPGGLSAHFVADEFIDARYLVVSGDDGARVREVSARVEAALDVWSVEDLETEFDVCVYPFEQARSVLLLGAGSPERAVDSVVMRVLEALRHKDPRVRRAAVQAMVYAEWPEYRQPLAELAAHEADPEVLREAEIALRVLAERHE
ncbi:HEAT repeat domain-containing protein [Kitasatospora sp. NPDC057500]|uniref:HEAT repeat domain-containing protein n=1 Tax=Kitasatospora sp. NPDC057500 TaxID=3346151 RepID=UPI0036B33D42